MAAPGETPPSTRAPAPNRISGWSILVGALSAAVYGYLGYQLYRAVVPGIEVSISADYEPYSRWLTVRGGAYSGGQPLDDGHALVVFETSSPSSTHSFHVPVRGGAFALDREIAAAADQPGTLRRVTATVEAGRFGDSGIAKVLGPNEIDGEFLRVLTFSWFALVAVFVGLFTGRFSHLKQRYAIMYSYLIAALFLIVPLIVPLVVAVVPGVGTLLAQTPVGFLQVGNARLVGAAEPVAMNQWSLNIGGTLSASRAAKRAPVEPSPPAAPTVTPAPTAEPPAPAAEAQPAVAAAPEPVEREVSPAAASGDVDPRALAGSAKGALSQLKAKPPEPVVRPADPRLRVQTDDALKTVYDVEGGLVVPLYVLILATLGGAFRMTRRVPQIERKIRNVEWRRGDEDEPTFVELATRVVVAPLRGLLGEPQVPVESRPPPTSAPPISAPPGAEKPQDKSIEERLALARQELTHQVLFMFTSPFMGVLAYYAVVFVHEEFGTRTPIIAIVAFVSGIKSEDVLRRIVRLAESAHGEAGGDASRKPPAKDPG